MKQWFSPSAQSESSFGVPETDYSDERLRDLRKELEQEQRGLAHDIEELFRAYDGRLQGLSMRLRGLSERDIEREESSIRQAQDELRRLIRRFQASLRTRQELERELAEWSDRHDSGSFRADHPRVRAEIARSELEVREPVSIRSSAASRSERRPVEMSVAVIEIPPDVESDSRMALEAQLPEAEPLSQVDTEHLLRSIREATREAERWHAMPLTSEDDDALLQLHHLRELHAVLKRRDRVQGVRRDRVALAVSPRGF